MALQQVDGTIIYYLIIVRAQYASFQARLLLSPLCSQVDLYTMI